MEEVEKQELESAATMGLHGMSKIHEDFNVASPTWT